MASTTHTRPTPTPGPIELRAGDLRACLVCEVAHAGSVAALARQWKISESYIRKALDSQRTIGPAITEKLGLVEVERRWVKKEGTR